MKKLKKVSQGQEQRLDSMYEKPTVTGENTIDRAMGWYKKTPRPDSAIGGFYEGVRSRMAGLKMWMAR